MKTSTEENENMRKKTRELSLSDKQSSENKDVLEEKAREYALAMNEKCDGFFNCRSIIDAYIAGANDALACQWRSISDALPPNNEEVLVQYPEFDQLVICSVAYWNGSEWYTSDGQHIKPTLWMSIPTNKYK
ncbi:MAG: DUF551 domain-containing protein [Bacteroides sp.]|nr:DUF551 domain-containing protein [Bacteroides sp.]